MARILRFLLALAGAVSTCASAQNFPSRSLRLALGITPGSVADVIDRCQFIEERYMELAVTTAPAEFAAFVRQDYERGGALVNEIKRTAGNP